MDDKYRQDLFAKMALIRCFEENILKLFSQGRIGGTTHTCIGQEAVPVALGENLTEDDYLFCPHRCHGYFIAYGGAPKSLISEMMGKESGVCAGRGGSQHLHYRRFFSNGIQGGIVGNAVGAALALKLKNEAGIAVAVLGDGTLGEGLVYESLNFAALKELPILFLLENNRYAQTTPSHIAISGSMTARAQAFGVQAHETDCSDVVELSSLLAERIQAIRTDQRPFFQVVNTYRLAAHSKGDDTRSKKEIAQHWEKDPLRLNGEKLDAQTRKSILDRANAEILQAVKSAENDSLSSPYRLLQSYKPQKLHWISSQTHSPQTFQKALNSGIHTMMEKDARIFFMGEDVLDPYGGAFGVSKGLSTAFPDRVLASPISEAGLVAWGVGAALAGLCPIVEIMFGDFLTLAADQLLNHAAKYRWISNERVKVPLVVRTPMGGGRGYGPTHSQSIEKMFLGIPGLCVIAANSLLDPGILLQRSVSYNCGPTLFIEPKTLYPQPLACVDDNRFGNFYVRFSEDTFPTTFLSLTDFDTPDICLMAYGGMTPKVLEVAERLLMEKEITADVIIPSQLYPHPEANVIEYIQNSKWVITIEEGQEFCGWGAEIITYMSEHIPDCRTRFLRIAAAPCPVPAAIPLEQTVLPSADNIMETIMRKLK
ncbi:MAG: pyruvate dehydrogenase, partial [Candidatus Hydrogenedentes bacterium]|nr:pyruvate dehydrogenase [Candidatus Hydrogenedentota bacterium]